MAKHTQEAWFDLEDGKSFLCTLPSMEYNRKFYFAVLNRVDPNEAKAGEKMEALVDAFVEICIVEAKGLPDEITPREYLEDNWNVLLPLFMRAQKEALVLNKTMEEAEKN